MNKKMQSKFAPYPFLITLLCVVASTLRTVATFLGVDPYGYFEHSTLFKVSAWMILAASLLLLTLPLAYRKRHDTLTPQTTAHTFLPSFMLGMLFLFFVGEGVFSFVGEYFLLTLDKILIILSIVLGVCCAIYFLSLAILESTVNNRKAYFGMLSVLFFGIYAASLYMDTRIPRNAHIELCEEMAFIVTSLYFLYEARISLGKQKQNTYIAFAMMAAALNAYNVIPTLIYFIATGKLYASSLTSFFLMCGVLVFILMRLAVFEKSPADKPATLVENLIVSAKARACAVEETEALYAPPEEEEEEIQEEVSTPIDEATVDTAESEDEAVDNEEAAQTEEEALPSVEEDIASTETVFVPQDEAYPQVAEETTPSEGGQCVDESPSEIVDETAPTLQDREFDFTIDELYVPEAIGYTPEDQNEPKEQTNEENSCN